MKIPQVMFEVRTPIFFLSREKLVILILRSDRLCGTPRPSATPKTGPKTAASPSSFQTATRKPSPPPSTLPSHDSNLITPSTGYGQHGDYVFGWEADSLQRAMDNRCYLRNCTQLTELKPAFKNECQVPDTVKEDIDGCE